MEGPKADRAAIRKFCLGFCPFKDQCNCAKLCILALKFPSRTIHHQQGPMLLVKEYFVFLTVQRCSPKFAVHPLQADQSICTKQVEPYVQEIST